MSAIATSVPLSVVLPDDARTSLLLALADDELITGHRASHWTGVAPSIEEDLAFSTIAQDEINHADVWYQVALSRNGGTATRADVDALGLGRAADDYRHAVLCERPPRDFAYTLARHWLYDHADAVRLEVLQGSSDPDIAAVATKLTHEERYHLEHADHWFWKCVRGGDDSLERLAGGLRQAWAEAVWLFEPLTHEDELVSSAIMPATNTSMLATWRERMTAALDAADLLSVTSEAVDLTLPGGRHGVHTDDFTVDVWPEMTHLYRAHPGATW